MKIFKLLFLLSAVSVFGQTRAIYEYRFALDSTRIDSVKTEWMYLDINEEGSEFFSKQSFESDSIAKESLRQQVARGSMSINVNRGNPGQVRDKVLKTYPDFKVHLITRIGQDRYKVLEDRKIDWKVQPEKKVIGEFNAQKATGSFAGREWEVWFTTDVPIQDGPYKFHGLPGLIVLAEDLTRAHRFEIKAVEKRTFSKEEEVSMPGGRTVPFITEKYIDVNRSVYKKQLSQHRKDPAKGMREILSSPNTKIVMNVGGKEISNPAELIREMEQREKRSRAAQNNPIELEL